ncbi:MAG TPA: hypothetical protein VKT78_13625 [Fimbriimonadaceae bacterium]|nr:hypothetical protein [Fimbriimonadaceae bacterium]
MSIGLKSRIACTALLSLPAFAIANTPTPWSNPLLNDVPAGAKGLVSIDLAGKQKPLTSVLKLVEGVGGNNLGKLAASGLTAMKLPKEVQDAIEKSWDRRAVLYVDIAPGQKPQDGTVLLLGLTSSGPMTDALRATGGHDIDGVAYSDLKDTIAHIEGNTLVLALNPKSLPSALKPFRGAPHIGSKELGHLSDAIEPTAEVVGWMDTDTAMSVNPGATPLVNLTTGKSFGFSLGLHAKGVSLSVGPLDLQMGGKPLGLSQFRPLPDRYMNTLPGGAYLLTCLANPWPLVDKFNLTGSAPKEVKGTIEHIKGMIRGNYVLGLYPTRLNNGTPEGVDLLMELRPNEGNDPAASMQQLMGTVKKMFLPGDVNVFESFKVPGADHAYRLNHVVASLLRAGLKSTMKGAGIPDSLLKEKNLVFAGVGSNIVVATSEPVLRKAVAALKFGSNALAYDPKFTELAQDAKPVHFVLAASLTRTLTMIAGALTADSKNKHKYSIPEGTPLDMVSGFLKMWPDPLLLRLSVQHSGLSGRIFLPVDFDMLAMLATMGGKPSR